MKDKTPTHRFTYEVSFRNSSLPDLCISVKALNIVKAQEIARKLFRNKAFQEPKVNFILLRIDQI